MRIRLIIWLASCLAISILSFGELWAKLPGWLSPEGLQRHGVFHWGVLCLCLLWLWLRRKDIITQMRVAKLNPVFIVAGAALLVLSLLLPRSDVFLVFLMLLGWLGVFAIIFSRAAVTPSLLLAIHGFSLAFPMLMNDWLGEPSAVIITTTVIAISRFLGLPVTNQGTVLEFNSLTGEDIATKVTLGCVGYATISVFIALFALMMLDRRLPLKRAWYVFLLGLAGTWLQNILRIIISIAAGYLWGAGALSAVHQNAVYFIFPLWYALFAYIYLRQAGWKSGSRV